MTSSGEWTPTSVRNSSITDEVASVGRQRVLCQPSLNREVVEVLPEGQGQWESAALGMSAPPAGHAHGRP